MTKFKASPSGFVFGTVLLLLVVVINNANAGCSSAMMFNSSSLEVAEEFARDSQGTTEIALDHLDRMPGRVLQSVVDNAFGLLTKSFDTIGSIANGVKPFKNELGGNLDKLIDLKKLYEYLDTNYCSNVYCYSRYSLNITTCECKQQLQAPASAPECAKYVFYHCCKGSNGACSECCEGKKTDGIPRKYITRPIDTSTTTTPLPPSLPSSSSSLQFPIAYVVLVVIAMVLPSFFFSYTV